MSNLIAIPGYEGLYAYDTVRDVVVSVYHDPNGKDVKWCKEYKDLNYAGQVVARLWKNRKCKQVLKDAIIYSTVFCGPPTKEDIKQMTTTSLDPSKLPVDGKYYFNKIVNTIKQRTADQNKNDMEGVYFVAQIVDLKPVFADVPVHYTNQFHARETCERLARETPGTKWAYFRRLGVCEVEAVRWTT